RCNVVRICNTVREYVYAPTTLRYWDAIAVPPSWFCCGLERRHVEPFGHEALRRHEDLMLRMRSLADVIGPAPSLKSIAGPPQTSSMLAPAPELEIAELKTKLAQLERKLNSLLKVDKPEKPDKKGDKS